MALDHINVYLLRGDDGWTLIDTGLNTQAARDCWDCMSCIKACPAGALEIKMPYQLGYFKATLRPIMGSNFIVWKCRDINGKEQTYRYVNRLDKA